MKNILIINGHPNKDSFCFALAESYKKGALSSGTECKKVHLIDLKFNPILTFGYKTVSALEPDLVQIQKDILWANHLVFVYPNWWSTYPALLKGFFDRVFIPGFAFKYQEKSPMPIKLLKGKSARLLLTMDSPKWYYWLINKSPDHNSIKTGILKFCGFEPVKISAFCIIKNSTEAQRKEWLEEIIELGEELK